MGKNQYKCPECDFVGKLSALRTHLKEYPSHWIIHCQDCATPILSKKDYQTHSQTCKIGISQEDIVNLQRHTKVGSDEVAHENVRVPKAKSRTPRVKSATKLKLMRLGISEKDAIILATGRNMSQLQKLKIQNFSKIFPDKRWKSLNELVALIIPDVKQRVSFKRGQLTRIAKQFDIKDHDIILETALMFTEDKPGKMTNSILKTAAQHINKSVQPPRHRKLTSPHIRQWKAKYEIVNKLRHASICGIALQNFKGFKETEKNELQFLPIRPLTLVYGPNNGGKSSVLKGFSSLGQTLAKRKLLEGDYDWTPNGMWYDLGAKPHILNNPEKSNFGMTYVFQPSDSEFDEKNKFFGLHFNFALPKNDGKLTSIELLGGEFEDFLSPIIRIEEVESFPNSSRQFEITYLSEELEKKQEIQLEAKSALLGEMKRYMDVVDEMEENQELYRAYYCSHCDFKHRKLSTMTQHIKEDHSGNATSELRGLSKTSLRNLRLFMALYEQHEDSSSSSPQAFEILLDKWRECLQEQSIDFQITEDYDLSNKVMNLESPQLAFGAQTDERYNLATSTLFFSGSGPSFSRGISFDGNTAIQREVAIMSGLLVALELQLEEMDYLGATRLVPRRNYSSQTGGQQTQGVSGERTLAHLAKHPSVQDWVNDNLADLIGLNIKVNQKRTTITLPDGKQKRYPLDELDVRISRTDSPDDRLQLPDVGFGVSQLLPILTGICTPGRMVIEEPEANLHPGAQQKLMSKIISQVITEPNRSSVLMETHSEHFLLEVLRAISDPDCELSDDDVAILYCYNTPSHGTVVKRHTTTNGTLDSRFPKEFTGDYGLSLI